MALDQPQAVQVKITPKLQKALIWILVLLAWFLPALTSPWSGISAGQAGGLFANMFMATLAVMVVVHLVFKSSSQDTKNKGDLASALLLFLGSSFIVMNARLDSVQLADSADRLKAVVEANQQQVAQVQVAPTGPVAPAPVQEAVSAPMGGSTKLKMAKMLDRIGEASKRQTVRVSDFLARFNQLDLTNTLTPETLTSSQGLANAHHKFKTLKSLVAERTKIYDEVFAETRNIIMTSGLTAHELKEALDGFEQGERRFKQAIAGMAKPQNEMADLGLQIVDICQRNLGVFKAVQGNIMFQTQEQLDFYQSRMARFVELAKVEEDATQTYATLVQSSQQSIQKDLADFSKR
jgi:hypothetical protein